LRFILFPEVHLPKAILLFVLTPVLLAFTATFDRSFLPAEQYTANSRPDSLSSITDSLITDSLKPNVKTVKISGDAISSKVDYKAEDSLRFEVDSQKVFLYGKAEVQYEDINLKANYIVLDMKNNLVYAEGTIDSTGKLLGKPEFSDGNQTFVAQSMVYNIKTKKGRIREVDTREGEGYLHGETIKKDSNNVIYMSRGRYTTCSDVEHPHYYFALKKLKVIPDDKIVTGPAYLVVGDIPTPLALPFGFFPNKKGQASGILIPQYGEAANIGFFLKDGGYYWGINDFVDLTLQGDIYTRGSFGLRASSNYNNRYRYNGNMSVRYAKIKIGEEGFPNYSLNKDFFVNWRHAQDPKAHPSRRFAADVNIGSSNFNALNATNTRDILSNTFQSTVRYDYTWANKPFNLSTTARHTQNTINRQMDLTIPDVNFAVNRFFLFRPAEMIGEPKWYQTITAAYNNKVQNQIITTDTALFNGNFDLRRDLRNGMNHQIPITTSLRAFKYFTFTPAVNYSESWYLQSIRKRFDADLQRPINDTVRGFAAARDINMTAQLRTMVYGMYQMLGGPVKAVRHVMTPSLGLTYNPGLTKNPAYIDQNGREIQYSIFEGSMYGAPASREAAIVNFGLVNNVEMKVATKRDSASDYKKIRIFENISFDSNYNMLADSFNLNPLSINARSQPVDFLSFNFVGGYDPYSLDPVSGRRVNEFEWNRNNRPGRLTSANLAVTFTMRSKNTTGVRTTSPNATADELAQINANRNAYIDFNIPWSLNLSYNYVYNKPAYVTQITQAVSINGDISVTQNWKVAFNTGYDLKQKQLTYTSVNIIRDLHCWEMRFNFVPFGLRKSYTLDINVKASILQDLKLSRKRDWYDLL
jgi:lipopolysaccharide assembly outer membrane protein LptD (OstA)